MSWNIHLKEKSLFSGPAFRRCSRAVVFPRRPSGLYSSRRSPAQSRSIAGDSNMEDTLQIKVAQLQAELDSLHKAITVLNQLAAELDIHTAMQNVRQVALELLDCERVTLFLIFERRGELRAMIDLSQILRIQFGEGIAGLVAQTGGSMNLPDVYEHPMFNKEVDRATGFRTRSMLCMAVSDMTGKNVAVLQALNKKSGQPFTPADERNLKLFGTHLGNTLVKAKLHETAKREKERLQAIYTCFKSLNAADEVGQMVVCATAALERHIIHAERVLFFLVDKPRGELWLHTHQAEPLRLRVGEQGGVVGACAESKKPQSWAEFSDPSSDPALVRLAPPGGRIKSVLVQPIHGTNSDRVLAVVLALNKREAEGTADIFFEPFFTDADCDAMALFAYEVGDLLSERTLELSLLSALSVVGHNGAHPNAPPAADANGAAGGGGFGGSAADGGAGVDGASTPGGGGGSVSGDEDLIRSRLIQMYLPEYKTELSGSHAVFSRNSFSATANQMRASMDRKRAAHLSLSLTGDGGPGGAKRGGAGAGAGGPGGQGGGVCASRRSDFALPSSRMGLAVRAAAARSFGFAAVTTVQPNTLRSFGGLGGEEAAGAGGSPNGAPASPIGGASSDASGDLPVMRSRSSTHAEQRAMAARYGTSGGAGGVPARSGSSMTAGMMMMMMMGGGAAAAGRSASGPVGNGAGGGGGGITLPAMPPAHAQLQHLISPQRNGWSAAGGAAVSSKGAAAAALRRTSAHERLMAPWRQSVVVQSAGGALGGGAAAGGGGGDGSAADSGDGTFVEGFSDDIEDSVEGNDLEGNDLRRPNVRTVTGSNKDDEAEAYAAAAAEAAGAPGSPFAGPPGGGGRRTLQLPEPFCNFASVHEELRAAAVETLRVDVGDPQALRTHLSCTNLAQASSPRSPCFYPPDKLSSWAWDFTEFTVEELIKLAYDIFIVSGAMEDFQLQPKVLRNFLTAVASHYQAIPYHNFNHVCHVLHATYLIATTTRAVHVLTPLERLALLLSALCHDLDHDGHSNSFHVNSGSELSRIYNDQSVMENHHCAMTFAILSRTDCNVLSVLPPEEQRSARKTIISAILCTDMANHFAITQEFQKHAVSYEPDNESDRLLLTKIILHAADIGNAVRPFHVNHAMSRRVHREFEAQSAEEVALGLPVTFSVDTTDHVMCARVELNFLDYVVTTLWERLVDVLPELGPQMAQLRVNRARYRRIADTGKTADQVLAEEDQEQRPEGEQGQGQQPAGASVATATATADVGVGVDTAPAGPEEEARADGGAAEGASGHVANAGAFGSLTPLDLYGSQSPAGYGAQQQQQVEGRGNLMATSPPRDSGAAPADGITGEEEEREQQEPQRQDSAIMPETAMSEAAPETALDEVPGAG